MRHRVWTIGWALGGVLLATQARAQCTKDTDCKGERICTQGQCVDPKPAEALPPPPPPPAGGATTEPAVAAAPPPVAAAPPPAPAAAPAAATQPSPLVAEGPVDDREVRRSYHRRSTGLMATGIVLTASALPFMLIGVAVSTASYTSCVSGISHTRATTEQLAIVNDCVDAQRTRNYVIAGLGIAMLGAGIPFIVYGAQKVADDSAEAVLVPWLSPTAGGATLRLSM